MQHYDITTGMNLLGNVYRNATITQVPGKKLVRVLVNGNTLVYRVRERTGKLSDASVDVTLRIEPDSNEMHDAQVGNLDGMVVIDRNGGYAIVKFAPLRTKGYFGTHYRRYGKIVRNTQTGGYKVCYTLHSVMKHGGLVGARLV